MPKDGAPAELTRDAGAVLQMVFPETEAPAWALRALEARRLGGVVLFSRNLVDREQTAALCGQLREADEDVLISLDEEGGDVTRLEIGEGSSYPGNLALGRVDDVVLTEAVARSIGLDLLELGVNFNYAPCADVNANPDNPVIGVRSFGAESELTARHTAAYVRGLQSVGVIATAKHFPGHGDTSGDSHLGLPMVEYDEALELLHLAPFRSAIEAGTKAIMTSHILFPRYDTQLPATMSPRVLTGLLRNELGFDGVIVTDGIDMGAISGNWGVAEGTVRAVAAGCDALCWGGSREGEEAYLYLRDALVWAVREGRLSAERLHEAAERNRAAARWSRQARAAAASAVQDRSVGLEAARRAITVRGEIKPLAEPPHVVEFSPLVSLAVDSATPWGLAAPLAELLPGTTAEQIHAPTVGTESVGLVVTSVIDHDAVVDVAPVLARAAARPLLLCVRDLHRNPWMRRAVEAVRVARPDAVVVEFGLPHGDLADLLTYGGARVNGQAAAELLTGRTGTTGRKSEH
ncbi:glycoside hydrolase family 3 protein [Actinospica durhamensis]|uniref:Glycoside hydrolase family 3 protein n=1 Tax=Actinospica durhamensis TaxID=1508375 RepID=A0A941IWH8_9ACTN|nr:glycoside hydrolase family 3 protein [Actinospica durhamensis]MBR7839426.1 glycoside hydrolase family 3 protein [Actinospica durhamensis]